MENVLNPPSSMRRRSVLAGLSFACMANGASWAQASYPSRSIKIIVPFGAGASADLITRRVAEAMATSLGQAVIVENRPGATGNLGTGVAAKAEPDGYTLVVASTPNFAINTALYRQLPFDVDADFSPISLMAEAPNVIAVNPSTGITSMGDLVVAARRAPGGLAYTSATVGSTGHLLGELLAARAGIRLIHVPDKDPITLVLGGHAPMTIFTTASVLPHLRSGRLKALAVTSASRLAVAPDVPTLLEMKGIDISGTAWYGLVAPRATPAEAQTKLRSAVKSALQTPRVLSALVDSGHEVRLLEGSDFGAFMRAERVKWAEAVRLSGARPE
ncbi:hypothetical protein GL58_07410 [Comamonas testosteroni]|uniref:Tripartite tricarboxylate transporter substrate binding protein n=3 Tax=Betaproteobacteria TaxID=28216 RepID=A0A0L7N9C5_COMTE|nr:hypothetical protein GL58_07410 [Comamonas testosteroni]